MKLFQILLAFSLLAFASCQSNSPSPEDIKIESDFQGKWEDINGKVGYLEIAKDEGNTFTIYTSTENKKFKAIRKNDTLFVKEGLLEMNVTVDAEGYLNIGGKRVGKKASQEEER